MPRIVEMAWIEEERLLVVLEDATARVFNMENTEHREFTLGAVREWELLGGLLAGADWGPDADPGRMP